MSICNAFSQLSLRMDVQTPLKPINIPVNAVVQKLFPSLKLYKDVVSFTNIVWHNLFLQYMEEFDV